MLTPQALENRLKSRLKLRQLKLLVAISEHGNILRAARDLNMPQPAATKSVHELEAVLDVSLFVRSSRGVTPTLYGEAIIRHAKLILSQLHHITEEITSLQGGTAGRIAVGTLLAAAPNLLPRSIAALKRDRPNISISVVEGTNDKLMPMLRVGDLDLVLGRLPEFRQRDGLAQEVLYYEPISFVARADHPLARRASLSLADLLDQDWILPPPQTSLRRQIDDSFQRQGLEPPTRAVELVSILTNHTLLLESDMIGVMPYQVVETQHGLVRLPVEVTAAAGPVGISTRQNFEPSPATAYFLSVLRRVAAEMARTHLPPAKSVQG